MTALILASASKARAALLKAAQVPFTIVPAEIDEDRVKAGGGSGSDVAGKLAGLKALAVARQHPAALVLGADQVLEFEGQILSKGRDHNEALQILRRLRGKEHRLITAVALAQRGDILWRHKEEAVLAMRPFSDEFLHAYVVREGEAVLSSVGGYQLEGAGAQLFARIEGDYFSILGLPLLPVLDALRERGVIAT